MNQRPAPPNAPGTVTIARPRDAVFVRDLQRRFSNQLGFLPAQAIEEYIRARRVLLIRDNGDPAGYLLGPRRIASLPHVRPLVQTAVCFDAQRRTLALQLVEATAADALAAGQSHLQAWCRADLPANAFWLAAGFLPIAQRQTSNARRQPLILWRRSLGGHIDGELIRLPTRAGYQGRTLDNGRLLTPLQLGHVLRMRDNGHLPPARTSPRSHGPAAA